MYLFVLFVVYLTVFMNCLVKHSPMCLGVVAVFLLIIMDVFSVGGGALLDRPCMVFHRTLTLHHHSHTPFASSHPGCRLSRHTPCACIYVVLYNDK